MAEKFICKCDILSQGSIYWYAIQGVKQISFMIVEVDGILE